VALLVGEFGRGAGRAAAARRVSAAGLSTGMPEAHGLAGDAELASDPGLADADGEQLGRAEPAGLEPFAFLLCRRAASDGRRAPILTHQQDHSNSAITRQADTQGPLGTEHWSKPAIPSSLPSTKTSLTLR
jgi:hypothetical protein